MILFIGISLCVIPVAKAVVVSSLYSVKVPVETHSVKERNQSMKKALKIVLIRVSGKSQIEDDPAVNNQLNKVNQYVREYHYSVKQKTNEDNTLNLVADANQTKQLMLSITFDHKAVQQILSRANQTVWGNDRPLTLIWTVVENGANRQFVSSSF